MSKRTIWLAFTWLFFLVMNQGYSAEETMIEDILHNPGKYANEYVTVTGWVTQYVPQSSSTTAFFLLKSKYGSYIQVNTSDSKPPEINCRYEIKGTVVITDNTPSIVAKSIRKTDSNTSLIWLIIIISLLIVVIVLVIILLTRKPKIIYEDFKTIKVPKYSDKPKKLRLAHGRLIVQSGPDKGKSFMLYGFSTYEGVSLTIGRDIPKWYSYLKREKGFSNDRLRAHILVSDPSNTLARLQAEFIYRDHQLFIRHLGKNPTYIDGKEVKPGQLAEFHSGSYMKAGTVELRFERS